MRIFKIILGFIIALIGFGMAAAGVAVIVWGTWSAWINITVGGTVIFLGAGGFGLAGIEIMRGAKITKALGGIPRGLSGFKG